MKANRKPTRVALDRSTARRIPKFLPVFTMTYAGPKLRIHCKIYDFPNLSKANPRIRDLAEGRGSIMSRFSRNLWGLNERPIRASKHSAKVPPKKGERPVGVPAARGHGGDGGARLEVPAGGPAAPKVTLQSLLQGAAQGPESTAIVPRGVASVDRPLGSIISSTKVPRDVFA